MGIKTGDIILFYPAEAGLKWPTTWVRRKVQNVVNGTPIVTLRGQLERVPHKAIKKIKQGRNYWREFDNN